MVRHRHAEDARQQQLIRERRQRDEEEAGERRPRGRGWGERQKPFVISSLRHMQTPASDPILFYCHCAWGPPPPRADVPRALRRDHAVAGRPHDRDQRRRARAAARLAALAPRLLGTTLSFVEGSLAAAAGADHDTHPPHANLVHISPLPMTLGVAGLSMLVSAAGADCAGTDRPGRRAGGRFLDSVHRRHRRRRHHVPSPQRRVRQEVPARDDGVGLRLRGRRWRRLAGRRSSSSRWTGPAGRGRKCFPRSTGTTATGPSPTSRARRGSRSRCTGSASRPRTSTTTATPTSTSRRSARAACSATTGAAASKTSPRRPASATPGSRRAPLWFDYDRDGRLDLFVARYVEWSIEKDLFCSLNGRTKSYCTPESYKGQSPVLYRNKGDGTFENVTQEGRARRSGDQDARRRADRLRRRRPARRVRRQRHAAEPAVPQQGGRHVRRRRRDGGRRVQRGGRRARRHGRGRRGLRRLGTRRASSSATSRTR